MYVRTLAALALLASASGTVVAANYAPGSEISVEGKVTGLQSKRAFWLQVEDDKVLVFTTETQKDLLYVGQQVRVDGRVSDDFIKLHAVEVSARKVESLSRFRAMSASALQSP